MAASPAAPDLMWGTDFTTAVTVNEGPAAVFVCVDHYASELIGVHASGKATRWEALEPVKQGVLEHCGGLGNAIAQRLELWHDKGTQYVAHDFQREIAFLGIASSRSFVRAPEGNGRAERIIRTLKGKRPPTTPCRGPQSFRSGSRESMSRSSVVGNRARVSVNLPPENGRQEASG